VKHTLDVLLGLSRGFGSLLRYSAGLWLYMFCCGHTLHQGTLPLPLVVFVGADLDRVLSLTCGLSDKLWLHH
jgi:hypothetical protein